MEELKQRIIRDIHDSVKSIGLNKLNDIIRKSEKEEREYGLKFCKNGNIRPSEICGGEKCHVVIKAENCKNPIGTFHTHPRVKDSSNRNIEYLGTDDIYNVMFKPYDFACLGLISNNKPTVRCFIPALDILPSEATIVMNLYLSRERYNKKAKELNVVVTNPDGTYKPLNELLVGLSEDKQKEISKAFNDITDADTDLYRLSDALAVKNRSKQADLIIE